MFAEAHPAGLFHGSLLEPRWHMLVLLAILSGSPADKAACCPSANVWLPPAALGYAFDTKPHGSHGSSWALGQAGRCGHPSHAIGRLHGGGRGKVLLLFLSDSRSGC